MRGRSQLLRARVVLPMSQPAIHDGAVLIRDSRIAAVGRWRDLSCASPADWLDLGEVVLMPGLINAHCHLDYTHMAGQLPPPRVFSDWLKLITETKSGWNLLDYFASWKEGAQMLLRTGTTTVADIEAVPELLPRVWKSTPLRVFSFLEMIAITHRRPARAVLGEALDKADALAGAPHPAGLSPHAPYTTLPELLRLTATSLRRRRLLASIHLAESELEFEMFVQARGALYDWLRRSGRDMSDCGSGSPVQQLERCGLLSRRLLAVHVNYLARNDARLLGQRAVHVVHCPRSHFYFHHQPFPFQRLARAHVNLCLGTDSLATVYRRREQTVELSMFEEMRTMAQQLPFVPPKAILRMATLNGALALGRSGQIGELAPRALADLIAVPFAGKTAGLLDALVHHKGGVAASMIHGQWVVTPPASGPAA